MSGIFEGPIPLMAGRLDGHAGLGDVAFEIEQLEGIDRDAHQDQDRHDRPGHLDQGVVGRARGDGVLAVVEAKHDIEEQPEDEERDQADDPEQRRVEILDVPHDGRRRRLEVHLPGLRLGGESARSRRQRRQRPRRAQLSALVGIPATLVTEPAATLVTPICQRSFSRPMSDPSRDSVPRGSVQRQSEPPAKAPAAARQAEEPTAICSGQRRAFVVTPRPCGRETTPLAGQSQAGGTNGPRPAMRRSVASRPGHLYDADDSRNWSMPR